MHTVIGYMNQNVATSLCSMNIDELINTRGLEKHSLLMLKDFAIILELQIWTIKRI